MTTFLRLAGRVLLAGPLLLGRPGAAAGQQPALRRLYPAVAPGQDSLLRLGGTLLLEARDLPPVPLAGLTLYLNGLPLRGLVPLAAYTVADTTAPAAQPAAPAAPAGSWPDSAATRPPAAVAAPAPGVLTRVVFALRREAAPVPWALADGSPWQPAHPVRLGLGSASRQLLELAPGPAGAVQLAPAQSWLVGPALVAVAGLLLLIAASRSWLLRAPVPLAYDANGDRLPVVETAPPYSLARTQLAWWSFLGLGGALLTGCLTGGLPALPAGTLALLGVSAGTAALAALAPARPATPGHEPAQSRGWLADLLSDGRGLALYRIQFVVTTLAVSGSLVSTLYATGGLPDWSPGPAILLAFSSLAYVAPKWRVGRPPLGLAPAGSAGALASAPAEPAPWEAALPLASAAPTGLAAPPPAPVASPAPVERAATSHAPQLQFQPAQPQPAPTAASVAAPAPAAPAAAGPSQPVAPVVAEAPPAVAFETKSRADLATGEVLYHEEDDMGPPEDDMGLPEHETAYPHPLGVG